MSCDETTNYLENKYDSLENLVLDGILRIGSATLQMKDIDNEFSRAGMYNSLLEEYPTLKEFFIECEKLCIEKYHMKCTEGHTLKDI